MKKFITMLVITIVTVITLPDSVKAGSVTEAERNAEISNSLGSDYGTTTVAANATGEVLTVAMMRNSAGYDATSAQTAAARDTTGFERTAETAKNWGGLCD